MKKIIVITASLVVFMVLFCIPRLQAEDWREYVHISLPIYVHAEGKPDLPILCFEALSAEELEAARGKYESTTVLSVAESAQGRGIIILWDESNASYKPQIDYSSGNNQSFSSMTAKSYK